MLVYRLISPSGKSYIGITSKSLDTRIKRHIYKVKKGGGCPKLRTAFNKYPPNMWYNEILYKTEDVKVAKQEEIEYIKIYDSINNGYNTNIGGDTTTLGHKLTIEHRKKISLGNIGRVQSKETREKISRANKGRTPSKEGLKKARNIKLGTKLSIETKLKMSIAHKKRIALLSPDLKQKHMDNLTYARKNYMAKNGNKFSEQTIQKMKEAAKNRVRKPFSVETKLKISSSNKKTWALKNVSKYLENKDFNTNA